MPAARTTILASSRRLYLRHPRGSDASAFVAAVRASSDVHARWVRAPATSSAFATLLKRARRADFECLLAVRREDEALVGVFDLSQIFRGIMQSAYLGYYAFVPHAGKGYMTEGLGLTLRFAFQALKLHRVECNIQPSNGPSLALVGRAGFVREGYSRRYLKIAGRWRDHERWALLVEDWRQRKRARG